MTVQYGISFELPMLVHPKFTVYDSNSNVRDVSWSLGYLLFSFLRLSLCQYANAICARCLRLLHAYRDTTCIQRHTRATTDSADGSLVHEGQGSNAKAQSRRKFVPLGRSQRGYQRRCGRCGRGGRCGRCGRCFFRFSISMITARA